MYVINPQRAVVLSPEKSLRFQISLERRRIVPVSTGSNEFLEWVIAPAALKSFEKYFLGLGKNLHPEDIKMHIVKTHKDLSPFDTFNFSNIIEFQ